MQKKHIVRLTDAERAAPAEVVKKLKCSSQKVCRARVRLKADANGPSWTDAPIAEAVGCRTKSVENIRERFVTLGFEVTLEGKCRERAPRPKVLDGEQEAQVIARRLGPPPKGFANRSLRLLAEFRKHRSERQTCHQQCGHETGLLAPRLQWTQAGSFATGAISVRTGRW